MTILVTDIGFTADTWDLGYTAFGEAANDVVALDVPSDINISSPINTPWHGAPVSTKWKSPKISQPVNPKSNGNSALIGKTTTIKHACAADCPLSKQSHIP